MNRSSIARRPGRATWLLGPLLLLVHCNSATTARCRALLDCCGSVPTEEQANCKQIVGHNDDSFCGSSLDQYRGAGLCAIVSSGGSDGGPTCKSNTTACTTDEECCAAVCNHGMCGNLACVAKSLPCSLAAPCCNGLSCENGVCGGGDQQCAKNAHAACLKCCQAAHMPGVATLSSAVQSCVCQTAGCLSQCTASFCIGNSPDATCNTCITASLGQGGSCVSPVTSACNSDSDCVAYESCASRCP